MRANSKPAGSDGLVQWLRAVGGAPVRWLATSPMPWPPQDGQHKAMACDGIKNAPAEKIAWHQAVPENKDGKPESLTPEVSRAGAQSAQGTHK